MVNLRRATKDGVYDHFQIQRDLVPGHTSKDGLIIIRSVSNKMDKILKNYEVPVLCAPAYNYFDKTLIERCHKLTSWRAPGSCYLRFLKSHSNGAFLSIFLKLRNYVRSECILIIYTFEFKWNSSFVFI